MKKFCLKIVFILLFSGLLKAQQRYWIFFKDTPNGLNEGLEVLHAHHLDVYSQSHWLNAATTTLTLADRQCLASSPQVTKIVPVQQHLQLQAVAPADVHLQARALQQIKADTLVALGLTAKGVKIGVIDGGYLGADKDTYLEAMIAQGQVVSYRNFIEEDITDPYTGNRRYNDHHGTAVLSLIGGRKDSNLLGLATEATYYLARTDQGNKEYRTEEEYWVEAVEWMHAQGVRLINSSLGYSTGFDDPSQNYLPGQVDGQSSVITQMATIAAKEKGMLLVFAAGNDGNTSFRVVSVPADAQGVLTVGASRHRSWAKAAYSSIGPEHLSYIKPDIVCYSSAGTSFTAPIITGALACLMAAFPKTSVQDLVEAIKMSGHTAAYPNNYIGHGVPHLPTALKLLAGESVHPRARSLITIAPSVTLPPLPGDHVVIFHKKDSSHVLSQRTLRNNGEKIIINRNKSRYTTVATPEIVYEIAWQ